MKAIEKEMQGISKFEHRIEKKFKSEDLDDSMSFRNIRMYGKTFFGSISARIAKTPYTLAARYQALKGNKEKQEELLFKATRASRRVIEKMRTKNRNFAKETESRTDKYNEVDDITTLYREREAKYSVAQKNTQSYIKENSSKDDLRKKVTLRLANIGQKRTFALAYIAERVEDAGSWIARKSAIKGHFKIADFAAKKTVKVTDYLLDKGIQKNSELYQKTDSIVRGVEDAKKASAWGKKNIALKEYYSTIASNAWTKSKGSALSARGIRLTNNAVTSTVKFFATNDMKISEFYAKALANIGLSEKSYEVMVKSGKRTINAMDKAEEINKSMRETFGFSMRRRRTAENSKGFMEMIKKGISLGTLKDSRGELSDWIEDIELRRSQQKVKRKYKTTGKRNGIIELLEKNSKGALNKIQTSLYVNKSAKAAAQVDLDMNPEKKGNKSSSRDDRG